MKRFILIISCAIGIFVMGCKKTSDPSPNPAPPPPTPVPTAVDKMKDTVLLYSREIYLWYKNIPDTFNPRIYADPDAIMTAIRKYSSEPGFSKPVDRYSFGILQSDWNNISNGISGDFGIGVFFLAQGDLRISFVEKESPAGKAGITRSWRITSLNGSTNITTSNASAIVDAVYYSNSTTFGFKRPDNTDTTITLAAASYQEHPVFVDTVYNVAGNNVGYMVLNSFIGDTASIKSEFARVFNRFATSNVQDVVIDLRYNGGGYVSLAEELDDYLVPSSGNGDVLLTYAYNDKYTSNNITDRYGKKGNLSLSRVFFIGTQNTASASELVINSLKPYLNVQLVGPSNTYGKPVGFFPIPVGNWYIFPISFRTINKSGVGNYFDGLTPNYQVMDGLDKQWGDVNENCLASVLHFIGNGTYARAIAPRLQEGLSREIQDVNVKMGTKFFKGSIGRNRIQ